MLFIVEISHKLIVVVFLYSYTLMKLLGGFGSTSRLPCHKKTLYFAFIFNLYW